MRFCKNCGHPLNPSHKVCTRCGKHTSYASRPKVGNDVHQPYPPGRFNDTYQFKKPNKPLIIISILVAIIAITLIVVFLFLNHQLSPNQTVDQISDALKKEDQHQLSKLLTSQGKKLSNDEANAYIQFLKNEGKLKELSQDLKHSLENMKTSKTKSHTVSINKLAIIKIEKKNKRFGIFDQYTFSIPKYSIAMYSKDNGKIDYDYDGKIHTIDLKKDEPVNVGTFPLGNYQFNAKKRVGNQTFKGNITILMTPTRSIVKENFKEKRFMISPYNTYHVSKIKLFINDKDIGRLDDNKVYGPYSSNEKVIVHLEGKVGKHTVKTNREEVKLPEGTEDYKTITLKFNSEEINQFVDVKNDYDNVDKEREKEDEVKDTSEDSKDDEKDNKINEDVEDKNETKHRSDLTQTEAIKIIKKNDNERPNETEYSYELQPYQKSGRNVVKVKNKKGQLEYIYYIDTKSKYLDKSDDKDHIIRSGFYE